MFDIGDKVVTHPAGTVGTVTERLYRVENSHGTCVASEAELKRFVSPEEVWQNLARKIAAWVWETGTPLHEDEWATIGADAVDYLQEQGIEATTQDKNIINLIISAVASGFDLSRPF